MSLSRGQCVYKQVGFWHVFAVLFLVRFQRTVGPHQAISTLDSCTASLILHGMLPRQVARLRGLFGPKKNGYSIGPAIQKTNPKKNVCKIMFNLVVVEGRDQLHHEAKWTNSSMEMSHHTIPHSFVFCFCKLSEPHKLHLLHGHRMIRPRSSPLPCWKELSRPTSWVLVHFQLVNLLKGLVPIFPMAILEGAQSLKPSIK